MAVMQYFEVMCDRLNLSVKTDSNIINGYDLCCGKGGFRFCLEVLVFRYCYSVLEVCHIGYTSWVCDHSICLSTVCLFFQNLMKYLQDESLEKKKMAFDTSGWQTENVQVCYF
jgi:hypothetical protein